MTFTVVHPLRKLLAVSALSMCAGPLLAATCSAEIEGSDAMQFSKTSIDVSKTCKEFKITLKNAGKIPKAAMGHNLVVNKAADMQGAVGDGASAGVDGNYVKAGDARVIAHTKILGPGESDTLTIPVSKLSAAESYSYFCSFPGHAALMKGTLKLVN